MKPSAAHPGFDAAAARISRSEQMPMAQADAILAAGARKASPAAKRKNPRLKRVVAHTKKGR